MQKILPARPNLEDLRSQAKALLSAVRAGEPEALAAFAQHHPDANARAANLSDAQLVIARKHDHSSWPKLVHHVDEITALEGTWSFISLEADGTKMPEHAYNGARLIIDGDRFRMASKEATYEGIMDVNVEVDPHTIDIDFTEGPEAGNTSHGIYRLNSDELTICLGFTGVARPTEFATKQGGGHALETLRRTSATTKSPVPVDEAPTVAEPVDRANFEVVTQEHEQLQGEWRAIAITMDGMPLPKHFAQEGRRFGKGTLATVKFGPQVMMQALTRIDSTQAPVAIDYLNITGPTEGQVQQGIMRRLGDDLQICFGEPGAMRPSEFVSDPGSGRTLSTWRRVD